MTTPRGADLYLPVKFADVPGWTTDDHAAALQAFRRSAPAVILASTASSATPSDAIVRSPQLAQACAQAIALAGDVETSAARAFFERHFVAHRVIGGDVPGLLTAYYEPILPGARVRSAEFNVPLHRRPDDLVTLIDDAARGARADEITHGRRTPTGVVAYASRREIDQGALGGRGLELFYVADAVERFFLQVQGSGVIRLPDGEQVRVTYDGKNGYPYTSVGRYLIDQGAVSADDMSLEVLARWLRADPERGRQAIWHNESYVFFREMPGAAAPVGVMDVPLTPLRSLALDAGIHALGSPVFVDAPAITHITGRPFRQLMIGQDVGSAIRGRERGDIFAGSGPEAGRIAGITKHPGVFYVLVAAPDNRPPSRP